MCGRELGWGQIGTVVKGKRLLLPGLKPLRLRKPGKTGSKKQAKQVRFLLDGPAKERLPGNISISPRRGRKRKSKGARALVRKLALVKVPADGRTRLRSGASRKAALRSRRHGLSSAVLQSLERRDVPGLIQVLSRIMLTCTQRIKARPLVKDMFVLDHVETMKELKLDPSSELSVTLLQAHADGRAPIAGEMVWISDFTLEYAKHTPSGERTVVTTEQVPVCDFGEFSADDVNRVRLITCCVGPDLLQDCFVCGHPIPRRRPQPR